MAAPVVVAGLWLFWTPSGHAGPPGPTDYRSAVVGLAPRADAVELSVVGGDAYLRLTVDPGHEVVVPGYSDEPYLRFRADGVVEENVRSPALYMNTDRYADVEVPRGADQEAEPRWHEVADDGSYAWHDHRIHWMSPQPPADAPRGSEIDRWEVPLRLDGSTVTVRGVLWYEDAPRWWLWALVVLLSGAFVGLVGRGLRLRHAPAVAVAVAAGLGCLVALVVAVIEQLSVPREVGRSVLTVAVPAVGVACALVALSRRPRVGQRDRTAESLGIVAVAAAGGWALVRTAVFVHPVLPTALAPDLDRAGTALALGLALGAAVLVVVGGPRSAATGVAEAARGSPSSDPTARSGWRRGRSRSPV